MWILFWTSQFSQVIARRVDSLRPSSLLMFSSILASAAPARCERVYSPNQMSRPALAIWGTATRARRAAATLWAELAVIAARRMATAPKAKFAMVILFVIALRLSWRRVLYSASIAEITRPEGWIG